MNKYIKKNANIDAVQLTVDNVDECILFANGKLKSHPMIGCVLETDSGNVCAYKDEYIVKDSDGKFRMINGSILEKYYDKIVGG